MKKLLLIATMIILCLSLTGCWNTGEGKHNCQITAVEKNGVIWQTNEVYVKSDISSSQEERYCLKDESLIPMLEQYSKDRTKVTLSYRTELWYMPWNCESDDEGIIYDVKEVQEKQIIT